jgi:hypothetical protein
LWTRGLAIIALCAFCSATLISLHVWQVYARSHVRPQPAAAPWHGRGHSC